MKLNIVCVDLFHNPRLYLFRDPRLYLFKEDQWMPIENIGFLFGPILDYKRGKLHKIKRPGGKKNA